MAESTFLRIWSALPRNERVTWVGVLLLLLSVFLVGPVSRALAPDTALLATFVRDDGRGPWGHPLRSRPGLLVAIHTSTLWKVTLSANRYSVGPDGVDEGGAGDDVALHVHPVTASIQSSVALGVYLAYAREGFAVVAGFLVLLALTLASRRARRTKRLTAIPAHAALFGYLVGWVVGVGVCAPSVSETLRHVSLPLLAVPPRVSITLTCACVAALLAGHMTSRSLERELAGEADPPAASSRAFDAPHEATRPSAWRGLGARALRWQR